MAGRTGWRSPALRVGLVSGVLGLLVVALVVGFSSRNKLVAAAGHPVRLSSSAPSSTAPASTSAAAPAPAPVNPLTGVGPVPSGPVVAVKIDDTSGGRPQRSIDQADIVYIELAEGGLTRLLAVFATNRPSVEAVRSTRASDPELLAQYGPIDFVASGGAANPLQVLDQSPLKTSINDRSGPGFSLDPNRGAPYDVVSDLATVSQRLAGAGVKEIGFSFAPGTSELGPTATAVRTQVGGTNVEFDWDASTGRYVRVIGGTRQTAQNGNPVSAANVIVQFCQITPYLQDIDVNGNPSQYTHTVGSGPVSVFRDGKRVDGTWTRPSADAGTTLISAAGAAITLAPGPTWVVLAATGTPLTSG